MRVIGFGSLLGEGRKEINFQTCNYLYHEFKKKKKKKVDACLLLFLRWARVRGYKEWRERAARGLDPSNVARKWQEIDFFFPRERKENRAEYDVFKRHRYVRLAI